MMKPMLPKIEGNNSPKRPLEKGSSSSQYYIKKWTTLKHNGVMFPPPYMPHGVKISYKGQPVELTPEQEEVATMFAVMKETEYYTKPKFRENFWNDWKELLGDNHVIRNLDECDFSPIYEWYMNEKERKKQMSAQERKILREKRVKEEKYEWVVLDGVKEKVGCFKVEPPGLHRGRGETPNMGKLRRRIRPCDVTINIGKDEPVPECPISGERWKEVVHDNSVTWIAFWMDTIDPNGFKYAFLSCSVVKRVRCATDTEKFEKMRKLEEGIEHISINDV